MSKPHKKTSFKKNLPTSEIANKPKPENPSNLIPPSKEKDEHKKWTDHPIYIVFTVFITLLAAVGGVPGIHSWFPNKPIIRFNATAFSVYPTKDINTSVYRKGLKTFIITSGTIYNKGEKTLYMDNSGFHLNITLSNGTKIMNSTSGMLPKNLPIVNGQGNRVYSNLTDLETIDKITPDGPIDGHLGFYLPQDLDSIGKFLVNKKTVFEIECGDIYDNLYSLTFNFDFGRSNKGFVAPKLGIDFQPTFDSLYDSSQK